MGVEMGGILLQSGGERIRRARGLARCSIDAAQGVIGVGRSRIELGCVPEPLFRFCFSTGVVQDKAQEIGHFTIRGCALEQIAAEDFSLRVVSLSARVSRGL